MSCKVDNAAITESESLKSKVKITRKSPVVGNKNGVETTLPLKYFSNFWRTLEILLINCKISL